MKTVISSLAGRVSALSLLALVACGGFGTDAIIGGTLSGLGTGLSVVLSNNGADSLSLAANGNFVFATKVAAGGAYSVAIVTQPIAQTCSVGNATGKVNAAGSDIDNVTVSCVTTSSVVVTVTGLAAGNSIVLSDGGTQLSAAANGTYAFPGVVAPQTRYTVTFTQPEKGTCNSLNATGQIPAGGVVNVIVTCT